MLAIFQSLHEELLSFIKKTAPSAKEHPSLHWCLKTAVKVLRFYPSGLTRCILLTEMESLWRASVRRGEHSGKLRQAVQSKQLSTSDILTGHIVKIDEYRYRLASDDVTILFLMHRRFSDFLAFIRYVDKCDFFTPKKSLTVPSPKVHRGFSITESRLLESSISSSPLMLPSEFAMFELDPFSFSSDKALIKRSLASIHKAFVSNPSFDDKVLQGCFVIVDTIAEVSSYPTPRASTYRLVSLLLIGQDDVDAFLQRAEHPAVFTSVCLFLYDDQTKLSALWKQGDVLWLHRPCLTPNQGEPLFGLSIDNLPTSHVAGMSMQGRVVYPAAAAVSRLLKDIESGATRGSTLFPLHIIMGTITCVCRVVGLDGKQQTGCDAVSLTRSSEPSFCISAVPAGAAVSMLLRVVHREVVCCKVPKAEGTAKYKMIRCLVLWCTALGDTKNMYRVTANEERERATEIGHVICVENATLVISYPSNQIPISALPFDFSCLYSDRVSCSKRLHVALSLLAVAPAAEQEVRRYVDSVLKQDFILTKRLSPTTVISMGDIEKEPISSLLAVMSQGLQQERSIVFLEGQSVNLSKIACFSSSSSLYPRATLGAASHAPCTCVEVTTARYVDCRDIQDWLLGAAQGKRRRTDDSSTAVDDEDPLFRYMPEKDQYTPVSLTSRGLLVDGIVFARDSTGFLALCLIGPTTVNMAPRQLAGVQVYAAFVDRIDDLFSCEGKQPVNDDALLLADALTKQGTLERVLNEYSPPDVSAVYGALKRIGYNGMLYFIESLAETVTGS